jgi:hypothetical protein
MGKINLNNVLKKRKQWGSGFQITNTETEGNKEGVEKGNCLFSQTKGRERIYCYFVRKPNMASEGRGKYAAEGLIRKQHSRSCSQVIRIQN